VRRRALLLCLVAAAAIWVEPGRASEAIELSGEPIQGGLVFGKAPPGSKVTLDGRSVRVAADGRFIFGFARDQKPEAVLVVATPDGARETRRLTVTKREYKIQRIDGLPPSQVTPSPEELERIKRERAKVQTAKATDSPATWFTETFIWPAHGIISGVYGSQRILNGEPRAPHVGVDIAAPVGTPVAAPASGRVVLAEPDLFFTGGTIILDHGHGLTTTYAHLSAVEVSVGQEVKQGQQIGRIGATGRVTGPHLHWAMDWFDRPLDAARMVGPMPPPQAAK
jgi:murein DD-endopeptidase MepM/ murein hydrolase activator NlpD